MIISFYLVWINDLNFESEEHKEKMMDMIEGSRPWAWLSAAIIQTTNGKFFWYLLLVYGV